MKTYDVTFNKYYTKEYNECMELLIRRLLGAKVLMEGFSADGEKMLIVGLDNTAHHILSVLSEMDDSFDISETEI